MQYSYCVPMYWILMNLILLGFWLMAIMLNFCLLGWYLSLVRCIILFGLGISITFMSGWIGRSHFLALFWIIYHTLCGGITILAIILPIISSLYWFWLENLYLVTILSVNLCLTARRSILGCPRYWRSL